MTPPRFYVDEEFQPGQEQTLPANVSHHLCSVLRMKADEEITLFNGRGGEYRAVVLSADKKATIVSVLQRSEIERESGLSITLAQGISKGQRMDLTIQKAVELGVDRIVPILNKRSTVQLSPERMVSRMEHWQQVIISACEQCGRNTLPELLSPLSVDEWTGQDQNQHKLLLSPDGAEALSSVKHSTDEAISLLIGSEGGLSPEEIESAGKSGYQPVRLGPRILRTETAALVVISICQALWGDIGNE